MENYHKNIYGDQGLVQYHQLISTEVEEINSLYNENIFRKTDA